MIRIGKGDNEAWRHEDAAVAGPAGLCVVSFEGSLFIYFLSKLGGKLGTQ